MKAVSISYLRSEANDEKLDRLIQLLEESGIHVVIDDRDLEIGDDLPLFMENNLVESDYIIVILTVEGPHYVITHGFTKKTQKTPLSELNHAKELRTEYYDNLGGK